MFFAGLLIVEFGLYSKPVIELLYGDVYGAGADASRMLIGATILAFFSSLAFSVLVAASAFRAYPYIAFVGLVVNITLNALLISEHSFEGAAVATLVTEALVVGLLWIRIGRVPGLSPLGLGFLARTAPAIGLGMGAGVATDLVAPWPVSASLAGLVYVAASHVMRTTGPGGLPALLRDEVADQPARIDQPGR